MVYFSTFLCPVFQHLDMAPTHAFMHCIKAPDLDRGYATDLYCSIVFGSMMQCYIAGSIIGLILLTSGIKAQFDSGAGDIFSLQVTQVITKQLVYSYVINEYVSFSIGCVP